MDVQFFAQEALEGNSASDQPSSLSISFKVVVLKLFENFCAKSVELRFNRVPMWIVFKL